MAGTAPAQVHPALLTAEDSGGSTTKPPQLLAFSFIPLLIFFRPASHQDTGLARPLRLFSFSIPISRSGGCRLVLGQPGWHQGPWPGALVAGPGRVRAGHEAAGAVLAPTPTAQGCKSHLAVPEPPLQSPAGVSGSGSLL